MTTPPPRVTQAMFTSRMPADGCPSAPGTGPAANCLDLNNGSWTGGFPPAGGAYAGWTGVSKSTFNGFIENGLTGATRLQLPFVQSSAVGAIDIVRRPQAGDTALLSNSRLYSEAEIRILLADNINDLHPERNGGAAIADGNDVQIGPAAVGGAPVSVALNSNYNTARREYVLPDGTPWYR